MNKEEVYLRGHDIALINKNNEFVYEVSVFCKIKNYYSLINRALYTSKKELSIVRTFQYNGYTIIRADLYSAPFWWLLENRFTKYIPAVKKTNTPPTLIVNKQSKK